MFPAGHVNLAVIAAAHGKALAALGRYGDAERELLDAYPRITAALGDRHPRAREVAGTLASLYRKWSRPGEAARWRRMAAAN